MLHTPTEIVGMLFKCNSDMNHADGDAEALIKGTNIYQNTHENSNISILNRVYNTLLNQSITTKKPNLCSCRLRL